MAPTSRLITTVFAAILIAATPLVSSAQTPPPTQAEADPLITLLARLQANFDDFRRTIPSFYCNEHIVSEVTFGITAFHPRTVLDATFRIRRIEDPKDPDDFYDDRDNVTKHNELQESRVITRIDGKSTAGEKAHVQAPFSVFGLFSGGLNRVSTAGSVCFSYELHPARPGHKKDKIEIDYDSLPQQMLTKCPFKEKATGRVLIDPITLQVVRLENTTVDTEGTWNYAIDYAPVPLGGKIFNLPTTITSTESNHLLTQSNRGTAPTTATYHLVSRYTNYHLRTVTSKILIPK